MFEAHPVPQNVTEFEFHLVGDMTIKQFIYLASGIGLAYLTFALLASKVPLLAYPLIVIFAGSGAALAFLPIQDRPLDHWLGAYFRAIFQPTKRIYKSKLITKEDPLFKTRLQVYLNSKRNQFVGINIPNKNVKSTPFSFNMNPAHQQTPAAPIIATATPPAAAPTSSTVPASSLTINAQSVNILSKESTSLPIQINAPQTNATVLGSAPLSSMSIPEQSPASTAFPPASPLPPVTIQSANTTQVPPSTPLPTSAPAVASTQTLAATIPAIPENTPPASPLTPQPVVQNPLPQAANTPPSAPSPINQPSASNAASMNNEPAPSEDELTKTIEIAKQVHQVQQKIVKTEEQINLIRSKAATQDANPKEYLDQFHQLLGELQNLNQQAANLSQQVAVLTKEPAKQINVKPELVVKAKSIPTITLTSIPNVLNGIVTDSKGNYLDGSIILAHDKQGIPVRALKTNKLGQFVAATPLNNGVYTITIEKENLVFDTIEIELNGAILKPILITSKPVAEGVANG